MEMNHLLTALPIAGVLLLIIVCSLGALRQLLFVCAPNEILIFSGIDRTNEHGERVGYRVLHGGRAFGYLYWKRSTEWICASFRSQ